MPERGGTKRQETARLVRNGRRFCTIAPRRRLQKVNLAEAGGREEARALGCLEVRLGRWGGAGRAEPKLVQGGTSPPPRRSAPLRRGILRLNHERRMVD